MTAEPDFMSELEVKVAEQLKAQRMGYLLGAGSSNLDNTGYPLADELWDLIKNKITDTQKRDDIQAQLDDGATGIEHALDLLDDGGASFRFPSLSLSFPVCQRPPRRGLPPTRSRLNMPYGQPPFAPVQGVQFPTRGVRLYGHCTPAAYALTLRPTYVLWRFPSSYAQQCASAAGAGVASSRAVLLGDFDVAEEPEAGIYFLYSGCLLGV